MGNSLKCRARYFRSETRKQFYTQRVLGVCNSPTNSNWSSKKIIISKFVTVSFHWPNIWINAGQTLVFGIRSQISDDLIKWWKRLEMLNPSSCSYITAQRMKGSWNEPLVREEEIHWNHLTNNDCRLLLDYSLGLAKWPSTSGIVMWA